MKGLPTGKAPQSEQLAGPPEAIGLNHEIVRRDRVKMGKSSILARKTKVRTRAWSRKSELNTEEKRVAKRVSQVEGESKSG